MVMCVVWWIYEGIINHFVVVQNGAVNAVALYSERLNRVCAAVVTGYYAALINGKHVVLQHDNATAAHTAALIKVKVKELLPEIEFIFHPADSPDLAHFNY